MTRPAIFFFLMQKSFRQRTRPRVLAAKKKEKKKFILTSVECIVDFVNNKLQPICLPVSRVVGPTIVSDLHKLPRLQRVGVCRRGNGKFVAMASPVLATFNRRCRSGKQTRAITDDLCTDMRAAKRYSRMNIPQVFRVFRNRFRIAPVIEGSATDKSLEITAKSNDECRKRNYLRVVSMIKEKFRKLNPDRRNLMLHRRVCILEK